MDVSFKRKFSLPEFINRNYQNIIFLIYLVLLAIVVGHHEPWMDEAQAWLLAKDVTLKELLVKYLRYEGSPGLWHIILMVAAKLGLPYFSINIISASFSAIGVWLFIKFAPFPRLVKILFPFTFFVFFQYGVVARSYCLIAPVLFGIALLYPKKISHPYLFALLLGILANISAHTFIIAGSIAFVHCLDLLTNWKNMAVRLRTHHVLAMLFLALIALAVYLIIKTPPDQIFAGYLNLDPNNFVRVTKRMIGGSLVMNEFSHWQGLSGTLAFIIVLVTVIWLVRNRMALLYLLPLFLLSTLFAVKYRNLWHQGVLFLLWIFVLWVSLQKYHSGKQVYIVWQKPLVALTAVVLAFQVYWCINSITYDLNHNYSASYTLSKYIKRKQLQEKKIYVSGWKNISVLPYFSKNIFYNHNNGSNHRFWNWSTSNVTSLGASPFVLDTITCEKPDAVIFASDHIPRNYIIELPGFRAASFFKGYLCWKTGLIEPECYLVFIKHEEKPEKIGEGNNDSLTVKNK